MSITFYPTMSDSDVLGYAAECYADYTRPAVQIGFAATRDESLERVAMHTLECDECRGYGAYVSAVTEVPEVNMSNVNAAYIIDLMGIEFDYCGSIPAAELLERVTFGQVVGGGDEGTVAVAYRTEGGATMVDCGRSAGYADMRLEQIREVAEWAAAHGRDVVWS
jgi:hypothetical protein